MPIVLLVQVLFVCGFWWFWGGPDPRLHSGNFSFKSEESTPNQHPFEVPVGAIEEDVLVLTLVLVPVLVLVLAPVLVLVLLVQVLVSALVLVLVLVVAVVVVLLLVLD